MLAQTHKVNHLKNMSKRLSWLTGIVAVVMLAYHSFGYLHTSLIKDFSLEVMKNDLNSQLADNQSMSQSKPNHGPRVGSSRVNEIQQEFEVVQNISDAYNTKTEFDAYIDQKSGEIDMNKTIHGLNAAIWGLFLAKARASFQLTDLIHPKQIHLQSKKVFGLAMLLLLMQFLKFSNESSLM